MARKDNFFILRGDGYDLDSANYLLDQRFEKVRDTLNKRQYTSKETKLTYRILNHWASLDMLPQGASETEGWHKFTMLELIWFRVALRFRDFGVPLELLGKVKEQVLDWSSKHKMYPKFEYYVAKAWFSDTDPYVLLLHNNFAEVATMQEILLAKQFGSIPANSDLVLVSLKSILEDVGLTVVKAKGLHSLSDAERDVLEAVRLKPNKELKISIDKQNRISDIEEIKEIINPEAIHSAYSEMKDNNAYGEVQAKYVGGKPAHLKISKRKKYKYKNEDE